MDERIRGILRTLTITARFMAAVMMYWAIFNILPLPPNLQAVLPKSLILSQLTATVLFLIAFVLFLTLGRSDEIWRRGIEALIGVNRSPSVPSQSEAISDVRASLNELRRLVSGGTALSEKVQDQILELYREALADKLTHDISAQLRVLIAEQFKRETEAEAARFLEEVNSRLQAASSTVTVRGFLNLVLGIVFAVGALLILQQAVSVLTPDRLNTMPVSTAVYLTAIRVSLALVVTLVAYFFLALYKKSLDDAKFYQNEMTDMSSRATALQLAYYQGDKESRNFVLSRLMESDRNGLLGSRVVAPSSDSLVADIAKTLIDKLPTFKIGA